MRDNKYYAKINAFNKLETSKEVINQYPDIFRIIVKHNFKVKRSEIERMLETMCYGNWKRLWETDDETKLKTLDDYCEELKGELFYCSDRMSWDRLMRIHWIYQTILRRLRYEK